MRVVGYCTTCHRVRQVNVSGTASLASGGIAQGTCSSCAQAEDDLRHSEPMIDLTQHLADTHHETLAPDLGRRQMNMLHDTLHHRDPNGHQIGHRHVGHDQRVLRMRGR